MRFTSAPSEPTLSVVTPVVVVLPLVEVVGRGVAVAV